MNVDTGELRRLAVVNGPYEGASEAVIKAFREEGFTPIPKEHEKEANEILGERESAFADMTKDTPLVNWAKDAATHRNRRNKNKARMAKASRKRNRKT